MATIKDVAALAGVSICTVSRALDNKNYVKAETRQIILDAAAALDYHPNHAARSLKQGMTKTIGLIVPNILNEYYPKITKSIETYAQKTGYSLILCDTDENVSQEKRIVTMLKNHDVDGVIALPCSEDVSHIKSLSKAGIPYVLVNRRFDDVRDSIPTDNVYGGYVMTRHLIDNGHTRIGMIFPSFRNQIYRERFEGAEKALRESNLFEINAANFLLDVSELKSIQEMLRSLLTNQDKPTAIFASNDMLAAEVYQIAYELGLNIPQDISVVGYDDTMLSSYLTPPLTTFLQPEDEIAEAAINYLILRINGQSPPESMELRGRIILRNSVRTL